VDTLEEIFDVLSLEYQISFDEYGLKVSDEKNDRDWHDKEFFRWFNKNVLTEETCKMLEKRHFKAFADYKELSEYNGVCVDVRNKKEREEAR
jgi:hypothetical protein